MTPGLGRSTGIPDVCTFGRTLAEAAANAREAIAVTVHAVVSAVELGEHFAPGGESQ